MRAYTSICLRMHPLNYRCGSSGMEVLRKAKRCRGPRAFGLLWTEASDRSMGTTPTACMSLRSSTSPCMAQSSTAFCSAHAPLLGRLHVEPAVVLSKAVKARAQGAITGLAGPTDEAQFHQPHPNAMQCYAHTHTTNQSLLKMGAHILAPKACQCQHNGRHCIGCEVRLLKANLTSNKQQPRGFLKQAHATHTCASNTSG